MSISNNIYIGVAAICTPNIVETTNEIFFCQSCNREKTAKFCEMHGENELRPIKETNLSPQTYEAHDVVDRGALTLKNLVIPEYQSREEHRHFYFDETYVCVEDSDFSWFPISNIDQQITTFMEKHEKSLDFLRGKYQSVKVEFVVLQYLS